MKKGLLLGIALAAGFFMGGQAIAHSPLCSCFDNGDDTITCEGGFSDGSAAVGMEARVEDVVGKVLLKGEMDAIGEYTFKKPELPFVFVFDAGPGHVVKINEKDIQ
ncbi:hypothetical protein [Trichloromonas sp.]|uniref:hypothetical protein n=1 Tax=Trichloromonas sp. TaxID=3069249 RepID=UPI002A428DD4|nr:hypothetical protein [Trichloromonas sp.]